MVVLKPLAARETTFSQRLAIASGASRQGVCVCVNTFHKSQVCISQKVNDVIMPNLWHIISNWRRRYWLIFISVLVYL